jgi:hypothetical protein
VRRLTLAARVTQLVLVALVVLGGCECRPRPKLQKTHLVTLTPHWRKGRIAIPDDGRNAAFVARWPTGQQVIARDREGPVYAQCALPDFSPVTRRLFYWALDAAGDEDRVYVHVDEMRVPTEFEENGTLVYSRDGSRWGAVGVTADRQGQIIVDGAEVGRHAAVSAPAFSPDGKHVAFLYQDDPGQTVLEVDGAERAVYPAVPAECARRPNLRALLSPYFRVFYRDDGSLLVVTQEGAQWTVSVDGTRLAAYDATGGPDAAAVPGTACGAASRVFAGNAVAAKGAPVAVWWERMPGPDERWRVVRDGEPVDAVTCGGYWDTQSPVLSDDGQHVVYACSTTSGPSEAGVHVVVDGVRHGPYDDVWGLELSLDGRHFAYGASSGGVSERPWRHYRDGEPVSGPQYEVWRPHFDPGGTRLAWQRRPERGERGRLGIDRQPLATFDDALRGPEYADGTVWWTIRRGRRVVRLDWPLE